jgi:predicted dehydrogenase
MSEIITPASRRDFLKNTGRVAGAVALAASAIPGAHASEDGTIRVGLVGCGGRGSGAAANAMSVQNGPVKLVAMGDVFEDRMKASLAGLKRFNNKLDVPEDRRFLGFDAYRKVMDALRPGDVVILTTPPAFRWVHFTYAIERGLNVFMEKPVTVDAPTTRRMLALADKASEKNLKVGVGLMCRHCKARGALAEKAHNGELGDLLVLRAYRMAGPTGSAATGPAPKGMSELEHQIRHFHAFLWASGGAVSDFLIHNIDEACWLKDDWPVKCIASGGRHYRGDNIDQNFDTYAMEYTFADGAKLYVNGRTIPGCYQDFATYAHGTKGSAIFSSRGHLPARSRIYKGQNFVKDDLVWSYPDPEPNPYQVEWEDLVEAIKTDAPYNEVPRGAMASIVTSMGRMASHTGREITMVEMMEHDHEFAPNVDKLDYDSPAPLQMVNGRYPVPMPGITKRREY